MNKKEYVYHLKSRLRDLPQEEINNALTYVEELFDEAGVENEQQVINDLGSPAKFAAKIKADFLTNENLGATEYQRPMKKRNGWKTLGIIILGILALPIGLPLALVFLVLIFVAILLFFIAIFVLATIVFASIIAIFTLFRAGIAAFAISSANALVAIGMSIMGLSLVIFLVCAIIFLLQKVAPSMIRGVGNTYRRLRNKGGVENEIQ